jgi:hypothetical protein
MKVKSLLIESNESIPSKFTPSDQVQNQNVAGNQLVKNIQGRWSRKVNKGDRDFEKRPDKTRDEIPYDFDSNQQIEQFY